jgi:hypothetical protein
MKKFAVGAPTMTSHKGTPKPHEVFISPQKQTIKKQKPPVRMTRNRRLSINKGKF